MPVSTSLRQEPKFKTSSGPIFRTCLKKIKSEVKIFIDNVINVQHLFYNQIE